MGCHTVPFLSTLKVCVTVLGNEILKIMLPRLSCESGSRLSLPNVRHSGEARKQKVESHPFFSFDCDAYHSKMLETLAVI